MNFKNLKIGTQLILGFSAMLLFVVVIGVVSYRMNNRLFLQTETMYDHPLQVREAIGNLEADVLIVQIGLRDLMLSNSNEEKQAAIQKMELSEADIHQQFSTLREQYLGPNMDVEEAYKSFVSWHTAINEIIKVVLSGEIEKGKESIHSNGSVGVYRDQMMIKIQIINKFAENKAGELFNTSRKLSDTLNRNLILLVVAILLLSLIINYVLLRNIRKPLGDLSDATKQFHDGNMNARSSYVSKNEFGQLSQSFNTLAESVQVKTDLDKKVASLAALMLSEYDVKKFFQATLNALATHTGSQMAAIYLLSTDKSTFEHFESIGVDNNARQSFAANSFEGEFGSALATHKIQYIKNIPEDTRFTFYTVSGKFFPREIITVPIFADNQVIAIISLASIFMYSNQAIHLIDNIHLTLSARVEGIMAYHKMNEFNEKLENQNSELEAQKTEMASQSAELTEQNTELEMQKKQLHEASRLKTNFLSNMSHELRTPLNSVIALSGVLNRRLSKKIPDEEYSYLEVIERNGKHLLTLINDILDISRIEAGREEIEITRFNVNNLIADIFSMIEHQAKQKNIELLHTVTESGLSITNDVEKCRHILQNLIGNAVKFTEKGRVEIKSRKIGKNLEVIISDTGIGISESHLSHIFEEFRQADGSTSRRFGGTGLGLTIAKRYANLLGGTISVTSIPDKGSEFTLTLPLLYAAENKIDEEQKENSLNYSFQKVNLGKRSDASVKTILLVEDSEPAIVQMKDFLEECGYLIFVAHDGGEALNIISNTIPDAMILDLMMPGIDGFEVLKTLREEDSTAHIPVLILTAKHITKEELKFLKRNNVHQLIQKGDIRREELLEAVESMVIQEIADVVKPKRKVRTKEYKPLVLVVEDNVDNMITAKALMADKYTIIEAVDGNESIAMARKYQPDLILMDIGLPGMDGIEAFKVIRNDAQLLHIPVIALTASAMTSDRESILAHGLDDYIAKPIDQKLFFKTINEVLYGK